MIYTALECTTKLELVDIETSIDEVEEFDVASTALLIWKANENELAEELSNVAGVKIVIVCAVRSRLTGVRGYWILL